jgi:predicted nucleic acid-binding Zn ribbon protein
MGKKKSSELLPASNVLQTVLGNGKSALSDGFLRWKIWRFWSKIVGETLARHCDPVGYDRGRLYIWVKSSARMQEIRFFEFTIRDKVNEHVGRAWVRGIRFTLDRHGVPSAENMSQEGKKLLE